MEIKQENPPNYKEIAAKFDLTGKAPIFCWGDIIYNPHGNKLPEHLIVHESVHSDQQKAKGGPEIWWKQYLEEPQFRLAQEVEAYRKQYQFVKAQSSRQVNRNFLKLIAKDLSSAMYGNLVSYNQAVFLIIDDQ